MTDVLDMTVIEELLSLSDDGDPELLLDLIGMFLADGPTKLSSIVEGLGSGDLEQIERAAHSLKGSSGNLGARRLQYACEEMQVASRGHDMSTTKQLAPQMSACFDEARRALEAIRQRYAH